MYRRVILEEWHHLVPYVTFGITFAIFVIVVARALLMRKEKAARLASLPLDPEENETANPSR